MRRSFNGEAQTYIEVCTDYSLCCVLGGSMVDILMRKEKVREFLINIGYLMVVYAIVLFYAWMVFA